MADGALRPEGLRALSAHSGAVYTHEDLKRLLTTLAVNRAHVVGFSLGGRVAVRFAITYPAAVERLVLIDPAVGGFEYSGEVQTWMDETWSVARSSGADAGRAAWRAGPMWQLAYERPSVARLLDRMFDDYSGWHWSNDDPHRPSDVPAIELLDQIAAPTVILVGERNPADYHRIADLLTERIPTCRKVVLPGLGHAPTLEDAGAVTTALIEFLDG